MNAFICALNRNIACLLLLLVVALSVRAEDIDIFVGNDTTNSSLPSVLVVLDNTSNWARQSQQWPGGLQQGQAEVRAIKTALADQVGKVNVGVLEFTTDGNHDGAFVRFDMQELTADSYTVLSAHLDTIFDNINDPDEKLNSGTPYGNLMRDVYSYLAGLGQSHNGSGTLASIADADAYATQYSLFSSPLSSDNVCSNINIIFVGNPSSSGPSTDSADNSTFLTSLYTALEDTPDKLATVATGTALPIPLFNTVNNTTTTDLGFSAQCYRTNKVADCTAAEALAGGLCEGQSNCACSTNQTLSTGCGSNQYKLAVQLTDTVTTVTPSGQYNTTGGAAWNLDDWAKFLKNYGVPITLPVEDGDPVTTRVEVNTFTVDVFNAQQNAEHTGLLLSTANVGGGSYYAATNEEAIVAAFEDALSKILSVSSTFAAVTLPLSATNRAQNENEVFIGMFRPDQAADPRWFGNLKRYQLGLFDAKVELADAQGNQAVNPLSGFATECAESFWSVDSDEYWNELGITPAPRGQCVGAVTSVWSDLPDGPFVEKGGVAQVARNSVIAERNLLTVNADGDGLADFTSAGHAASIGGADVYSYVQGGLIGVGEVDGGSNGRPSIHGDVIHSRPLPVNYGDAGTVVYYGSNDGLLRAISTSTGAELWGLVAPEHFSGLQRLYTNSPRVAFPGQAEDEGEIAREPKGYFFDGSIGQIVNYDADNQIDLAYIYPTMRRGGRMVYALNVTDPANPALLWRRGCSSLSSDDGCDEGFETIGQTWSTPKGAFIQGYEDGATPVVIFGGGYDACEDTDALTTTCDYAAVSNPSKGNAIYILNAATGELLKSFPTEGAVVSDVNTVDVNNDGKIDYAYAVDTLGNIWRIKFVDPVSDPLDALEPDSWGIAKVAYTQGGSRRFMNTPALLPYQGKVYIALGSGNRERPLESNYPYTSNDGSGVDDRFYVFLDYPASDPDTAINLDGELMNNATSEPNCDAAGIYPGTEKRGWFMSMPGRGEQIVNPAAIAGDVLFNSYQPGGTQTGMCSRPLGIAKGYAMSLFNGSACGRDRSAVITGGGMPIAPTISTVNLQVDPDCVSNCATETVTVCIGCEGLKPTEIEPSLDDVRRRIYWNSEVDR